MQDSTSSDSPSRPITVETRQRIAVVTLNNPARMNALSRTMRAELTHQLSRLNEDPSCRAIVLTGAGGNFTSGGDLTDFNEVTLAQCRSRLRTGPGPLMREMVSGPKPLVAAVEGYAYGAGMSLSGACDYVVASRTARFRCAFTRVGLIPDLGLLYTLPQRVGAARARRLIALAEELDANEALRIGFVDELAPTGAALDVAMAVAERYACSPPLTMEFVKQAFAQGLEEQLRTEVDLQPIAMMSEDFREGIRAFKERREPVFTGR